MKNIPALDGGWQLVNISYSTLHYFGGGLPETGLVDMEKTQENREKQWQVMACIATFTGKGQALAFFHNSIVF